MKNRLFTCILFVVLGFLIAVGPQTIFPVCPVGDIPMKCHWTARAELGAGALVAVTGILLLLFSNSKVRSGLSLSLVFSGIFALLIPTTLIGVCGGVHMDCNKLTLPALIILSGIVIVAAAINSLYLLSSKTKEDGKNAS